MLRSGLERVILGLVGLALMASSAASGDDPPPLADTDLYDGQHLIDIQINLPPEEWKQLRNQTLDFVTAFGKGSFKSNYSYFASQISVEGRKLPEVELRKKGFFGSMDSDRPSLRVRVSDADQRRLLGGTERLTLNNNKQDRSVASQWLGYRLFRAAGLPAPRSGLAKVSVNGTPLGVYSIVEPIDASFLQRTFRSSSGNLYEGVFPTDFVADRLDRFDVKQSKKPNDKADLKQVIAVLEQPGADLVARLEKHFNLDEFLTYWALESLIGFWDGYAANQNNFYLYASPEDGKLHFIPWGADMAFTPPFFPGGAGKKSVYAKGLLAYRLNQDAAIRQRYHAALLKLLETVWNEDQLIAEVDRIAALVKGDLHPSQGDIDQSAAATRQFIKGRRKEILDEIKDGPVQIATPPAKMFYMVEAGQVSGSFATQWSPADLKPAVESDRLQWNLAIKGEPVKISKPLASAGPSQFQGFGGPPPQPGALPPMVQISGIRDADNKKVSLTLMFQADTFAATGGKALTVQGMLVTEGDMFGGFRSFLGEVELKSAGQTKGDPVIGSLKGKLYEMRGGFGG